MYAIICRDANTHNSEIYADNYDSIENAVDDLSRIERENSDFYTAERTDIYELELYDAMNGLASTYAIVEH